MLSKRAHAVFPRLCNLMNLSYEWVANLYYKKKDWRDALRYYTSAYEMALKLPQTAQLAEEIEWYRKRIETVKGNLAGSP